MRKLISIVEYGLAKPHSTKEWREKILAGFQEPESMISALSPEETGLPYSVYASETPDLPAIVIDSRKGRHFAPDDNAIVLTFGESSGNQEIDAWLALNMKVLKEYSDAVIGTSEFMQRLQHVKSHLVEMANFRRGEHNLPVTIWIRTEPDPLPHRARVKCNTTYTVAPSSSNFSIKLEPTVELADDHATGEISQRDLNGIINWIRNNRAAFLQFYYGQITQTQFDTYINNHPYQ